MADTLSSKRHRDETQLDDVEDSKRHKSYNHILSLLEEEEEEPTQDISSLITTLQRELSDSADPLSFPAETTHQENALTTTTGEEDSASSSYSFFKELDEEDEKERVIRHLLEASDDELGIPNREIDNVEHGGGDSFVNGGDGLPFSDVLWEFEDVTANYYALLQSELFMM